MNNDELASERIQTISKSEIRNFLPQSAMYMNVSFLFILLNYAITMSTVSTSDVKPMDESSDRLQWWLGRWTESK